MIQRIYADSNSITENKYWALRIDGAFIADVAERLGLYDGMPVIIYYTDESEEFEFDGTLFFRPIGPSPEPRWVASVDHASLRIIR
jgi:hypothetical protein